MRHRKLSKKLGRSSSHREATVASLVCHLIEERRIQTTLAKAKVARRLAEKMVTLGRAGTLAARRQAIATLHHDEPVSVLFSELVPQFEGRSVGIPVLRNLAVAAAMVRKWLFSNGSGLRCPTRRRAKMLHLTPRREQCEPFWVCGKAGATMLRRLF